MDHYARSLGVQTASVSQAVPGHSHLVRYRSNLNNCCLQQGLHKLIPPEHDLTSPNLQPITIPSNSWNHSLESTVSCLSCNNVHPTLHLMQASRAGGQTSMSTAGGSARLARLTGYLYHELYFWHNPGPIGSLQNYLQPVQHFEHTETKRRLHNLLDVSGLLDQLKVLKPRPATLAELTRAHTVDYVESVKAMSEDQSKVVHRIGDESAFMPGGFDIAALAAGGAITATEQVLAGDLANVYALCRPPGHHAEQQMGGGYCLFNNVAIAALHALTEFQLDRVAVVDFDVHHGNGTQQVFQEDDRVLFISVHQAGNYPSSSGQVTEVGQGRGVGTTLNIPLPPGSGSGAYRATFDKVIGPALDIFKPQLIFVSAGQSKLLLLMGVLIALGLHACSYSYSPGTIRLPHCTYPCHLTYVLGLQGSVRQNIGPA
eukprot:GHRR01024504.1.p1 GENE.GHRR01024504.1~~GHRR01024504.1.p1  ORF type:complete len:429 (+),score=116.86 GHRR01024504.1:183-1469(+)